MDADKAGPGLTGGCQCGAVRYRLNASPKGASICHCRMCQKAGAAPYMAFAPVQAAQFEITRGALGIFKSSDIAERGFCAACGTPLTYRNVASSRISVTICSLDDPNAVPPEFQLGAETAVGWVSECLTKPNTSTDDWFKSKGITHVGNHQQPDRDI
ncbi:MAG TPA: GFA family protein [Roseiarcus sp.]|jgi:hypothetical protein